MLLCVVLRNDGEINVIDHARVVKMFRDPLSSLSDYYSVIYRNERTDYRLALWLRLASPTDNTTSEHCLLLAFANSLDPDQARQNIRPDLDPNYLTL